MAKLGKAVAIWLSGAFLGVLAWRDSAPPPSPPVWPAAVIVESPRGGAFCGSRELQRALRERAFEFVSDSAHPPELVDAFTLVCSERDDASGEVLGGFELRSPRLREPAYSDAFASVGPATRQERTRLAEELADRLAAERSVSSEVERVFLTDQNAVAQAGAVAFAHGDWLSASRLLFHGLEGLGDPAQAYYGLSAASARLGRPEPALWYALAFVKSNGGAVAPASLAHLRGLPPESGFDPGAARLYNEARRLVERGQLRQAFVILKLASELVPWDPRPSEAVAELYERLGFELVAAKWRARAKLARRIAADPALRDSLLTSVP